ncbi:MAG: hypothetical protein J0I77_02435 [Rudaea sp.]|uniref:hypothetical protein n=1 Tax=unclassified Rudaea TaxID=2627037 RepID=UPI0014853E28|nr:MULTISPECIES: hypothetical protein [unclassified Rudaea]MBN8884555.1 hypothetical protein [Rudaea sp.]
MADMRSGSGRARKLALCCCAWLLPAIATAAADEAWRYRAVFDAAKQSMRVSVCARDAHARIAFAADSAWAMRFIADIARDGSGAMTQGSGGWSADDWHAGECLSYRADLAAIAAEHKPDVGWRSGDDIVAAPQLWLLRPDAPAGEARIRVELPAGWSISAPWRSVLAPSPTKGDEKQPPKDVAIKEFVIPDTPADWSASVAFGHFDERRIELPGGVLRLSILGGVEPAQKEKLERWFGRVARAVLGAYGRVPLPDVQVLMIPVAGRGRAVVFGQSVRGQGNALQLLIDPSRAESEFDDDWMAVHELSHLMHPYLGDRGSWLAEGLATYYQNVLRARGGLLTPAQAWDRLAEGFGRGAGAGGDETLEQTAEGMEHTHNFQRVYWAGAAFWLTVDRDLRRASGGKVGLDTALSRFRDGSLPAYRQWRPEDFVAKLDALAGSTLISARYREFAAMRGFPDWRSIYADLGIGDRGGRMRFDEQARDAAIREAIMRPKAN